MSNTSNIQHLGIIMDGNSKWANSQGFNKYYGHKKGVDTAKNTIQDVLNLGIKHLTLYAFSIENWQRPKDEVQWLMKLLSLYLQSEKNNFAKHGIKFKIIGSVHPLPPQLQIDIQKTIEFTKNNDKMNLYLAFSYGGRNEIIDATKKIIQANVKADEINTDLYKTFLYDSTMPDLDLIIRTGGQKRISNFLLWHCAYSELYFIEKYWPDFTKTDLENAIAEFNKRIRTFGGRK